jgi:hypothetical protein
MRRLHLHVVLEEAQAAAEERQARERVSSYTREVEEQIILEIFLAQKSKMIYSDFSHHNEFNNIRSYNPYASEIAFLRMENAFSNFRNVRRVKQLFADGDKVAQSSCSRQLPCEYIHN